MWWLLIVWTWRKVLILECYHRYLVFDMLSRQLPIPGSINDCQCPKSSILFFCWFLPFSENVFFQSFNFKPQWFSQFCAYRLVVGFPWFIIISGILLGALSIFPSHYPFSYLLPHIWIDRLPWNYHVGTYSF